MDDSKALKESHTGTERNTQNELIDLFGEINAEQLLIEPGDIPDADSEFITSAPGHFNHKEWLQKLDKEVCNENCNEKVLKDGVDWEGVSTEGKPGSFVSFSSLNAGSCRTVGKHSRFLYLMLENISCRLLKKNVQ